MWLFIAFLNLCMRCWIRKKLIGHRDLATPKTFFHKMITFYHMHIPWRFQIDISKDDGDNSLCDGLTDWLTDWRTDNTVHKRIQVLHTSILNNYESWIWGSKQAPKSEDASWKLAPLHLKRFRTVGTKKMIPTVCIR